MSYCRFGWGGSDVYMFGTTSAGRNVIECCGCHLATEANPGWVEPAPDPERPWRALIGMTRWNGVPYQFETYRGIFDHIAAHRAVGDHVPADVDEELRAEMVLSVGDDNRWLERE